MRTSRDHRTSGGAIETSHDAHSAVRSSPYSRRPIEKTSATVSTPAATESDRPATSDVPKARSQPWSRSGCNAAREWSMRGRSASSGLGLEATRRLARRGARVVMAVRDEAKAESAFNVEGVPALQLEVVDLEDPTEVGGDVVYEIRVKNQGSGPCTNIQIMAQMPDGLQYREASGPVGHRLTSTGLVFEPLPKLASKADVVYRIKVKGIQPGDYRFKVQMTCEQLRQPVNKEESSRVYKD